MMQGRRTVTSVLVAVIVVVLSIAAPAADDLLIADFEGKDYGDWKVEGKAFGAWRQ